jgi:o-succinylbenzoate---CoA ligase
VIFAAARAAPDRLALLAPDGTGLSYAALAALVTDRLVSLRRAGLTSAALVAPATTSVIVDLLALFELGAPVVMIHPRLVDGERRALLGLAPVSHLVDGPGPPIPVALDAPPLDAAVLVFTSGTTGVPKAARLSLRALTAAATASAAHLGWRDDDRWLLSLPIAHVGGLGVVVRCVLARRTIVLGTADPDWLVSSGTTLASLVPTQAARVVHLPPPPRLRAVLLGGAAAPTALLAASHWPLFPTYGLTEACGQVTTATAPNELTGGSGRPLPGVRVRIAADSRIEVASPALMDGYLGQPPITEWLTTGDHGCLDADGHLHVLGRRTDLIVTGGENVYPAEVEAVLDRLPGVAASLVVGIPDAEWGQRVAALLVTTAPIDDTALAAHLAAHLAPHKRPRAIRQVSALPLTPAGKPDRAAAAVLVCRA